MQGKKKKNKAQKRGAVPKEKRSKVWKEMNVVCDHLRVANSMSAAQSITTTNQPTMHSSHNPKPKTNRTEPKERANAVVGALSAERAPNGHPLGDRA
jgi:hypothetical protein